MPAPFPEEFRQRAGELARERAKPIRRIAEDLGISESCLRRWMAQADIDAGTSFRRHKRVGPSQHNRTTVYLAAGLSCAWPAGMDFRIRTGAPRPPRLRPLQTPDNPPVSGLLLELDVIRGLG